MPRSVFHRFSFYAAVVPLVGGRLRHFAHKWKSLLLTPPSSLQCSSRMPSLSMPTVASYTMLMNTEHIRIIDEEVEALLAKGAIEEVSPSLGYYSKMFVVPKKDGEWHPIINLKCLNKTYMVPPCFQMDTPWDIVSNLHPGD